MSNLSRTQMLLAIALAACALGGGATRPAFAQDEIGQSEQAELLHRFHRAEFAKYQFSLDDDHNRLRFVETPVMTWQGDGDWFGDLFIWSHQGRPQLIGCIGTWKASADSRGVFHEFHSLANVPLSSVAIGRRHTWKPNKALDWTVVPDAPPPAKTAGLRAIQMRNIARQLTVEMEAESGRHELRLLPQPLYRYDSRELNVVDGALFSYVWTNGTDPEFLLMVECRGEGNSARWHCGPARFTYREMTVSRDGKQLWQIPRHNETYEATSLTLPYATVRVENVGLADLKTAAAAPEKAPAAQASSEPVPSTD